MEQLIKFIDFEPLYLIFALANTPNYLYKNFQRNQSVLNISSSFTEDELVNCFNELIKIENKSTEDWITLYVVIVALSFKKKTPQIDDVFKGLPESGIKWGNRLAELYFERFKVYEEELIKIPIKRPTFRVFTNENETYSSSSFIVQK